MIGRVLDGRYEITKLLGRGGMGVVYLARDEASSREVVVKMIAPVLRDDEEAVARFEREARRLKGLDHPNIVRFLDYGCEDDLSYLVMEYVDGELLRDVLERHKKLSFREFVPIASQVLKGVGYAHSRDVLLRDIKPSNIMLCQRHGRRNFVKLLDFGLAKIREGELPITTTHVLGTIGYMAPEVLRGASFDLRGDVYALGVLFYRMLSGRLPFQAETQEAIFSQTLNEAPPRLEDLLGDKGVPPGFYDLVHRCLEKDPDVRPADANAIVEELIDVVPAALFRLPRAPRPTGPAVPWEFSDQYPTLDPPSGGTNITRLPTTASEPPASSTNPSVAVDPSRTGVPSPPSGKLSWAWAAMVVLALAAGATYFGLPRQEVDLTRATAEQVAQAAVAAPEPIPSTHRLSSSEISRRLRDAERASLQGNYAEAIEAYLDVLDELPDHALAASGLERVRAAAKGAEVGTPPELPPPPPSPAEEVEVEPTPKRAASPRSRTNGEAVAKARAPEAPESESPSGSSSETPAATTSEAPVASAEPASTPVADERRRGSHLLPTASSTSARTTGLLPLQ